MAYRFKRKESIGTGVERMLQERIDRSIVALSGDAPNIDLGIHEARKNFKKSRSLLRLIRREIPDDDYHKADHFFRSASLRLSDIRDAKVMTDTIDGLGARFPKSFKNHHLLRFKKELSVDLQPAQGLLSEQHAQGVVEILQNGLAVKCCRVMDSHNFSLLAKGFKRGYQGGRKSMGQVIRRSHHQLFHDWRKRVKDQWYHTMLLRDCWPDFMRRRRLELKALAELLGDYNDLSVLQVWCDTHQNRQHDERFDFLTRLTHERQRQLKKQALKRAGRIYDQKPKILNQEMALHWTRWKRG